MVSLIGMLTLIGSLQPKGPLQADISLDQLSSSSYFDQIMVLVSDHKFLACLFIGYFSMLFYQNGIKIFKPLGTILVAFVLTDSFCFQILKPSIGRYRPCYERRNVELPSGSCGGNFSFASNHAANGAAVFTCLFLFYRRRREFFIGSFVLMVGYSRVYLGVHYPLDIFAGFMVGSTLAATVLHSLRALKRKYRKNPLSHSV